MPVLDPETPLTIGGLIFPRMDQFDFTGPFEVLAQVPNARFLTIAKDLEPVRDMAGLRILPDTTFEEAPQLDVLLVPGGYGQEDAVRDEVLLAFVRRQAADARYVYSVCTGALVCGAAGLLSGRRATTHWTAMDALPHYGAIPSDDRVVVDGNLVTAGGVTSGIDGALVLMALLRGESAAQAQQLLMQYDPHPPFDAGSPAKAPADVLEAVRKRAAGMTVQRVETARAWRAGRG